MDEFQISSFTFIFVERLFCLSSLHLSRSVSRCLQIFGNLPSNLWSWIFIVHFLIVHFDWFVNNRNVWEWNSHRIVVVVATFSLQLIILNSISITSPYFFKKVDEFVHLVDFLRTNEKQFFQNQIISLNASKIFIRFV